MEVKAEYRTIFAEESKEHLEAWESALLNLEKNPGNKELINEMFRAIHTLKGSSGFIGFKKLQQVTHDLENALQDARDGYMEFSAKTVELLFQGLDLCDEMVESFTAGQEFEGDIEGFLDRLWTLTGEERAEKTPQPDLKSALPSAESEPGGESQSLREGGQGDLSAVHRR